MNFTEKIKQIHGNKYKYDMVIYVNQKTKIILFCNNCKQYIQKWPSDVLYKPNNACSCLYNKKLTTSEYLQKLEELKYDYSKTKYIGMSKNIIITCKIHGDFKIIAGNHLYKKSGCPRCSPSKPINNDDFINFANIKHNNLYTYSKCKYITDREKVIITCKLHGDFSQRPSDHKQGQGCPICKSSQGEKRIKKILDDNNIKYVQEKRFDDCKYKNSLPFDFYIHQYKTCIEYDGIQHFQPIDHFGGENAFIQTQYRDSLKTIYCNSNNFTLIRISYKDSQETIDQKLQTIKL